MQFLAAVAVSQIGTHGTFAAMLYHVYDLTGSTVHVGLVGLSRGLATWILSPFAGYMADRFPRHRLLQSTQVLAMFIMAGLAATTLSGVARPWMIASAAFLNGAVMAVDSPTRKAIIPAITPHGLLSKAVALITPTNQLGKLIGPAIAGGVIAVGGPGWMYLADALTFPYLIWILATLKFIDAPVGSSKMRLGTSIKEAAVFLRNQPRILQFITLDLSATLFAAYQVVLPALAIDVLDVGPSGYGVLASAPAAGALFGAVVAFRLSDFRTPSGLIVLGSTISMGISMIGLGLSGSFPVSVGLLFLFGLSDSIATIIRHAAVLLETPDALRGRVGALYRMASNGGPAMGQANVGLLAGAIGIGGALTVGGSVPIACSLVVGIASRRLRKYRSIGN